MKIVVVDVAFTSGGAEKILRQYYENSKRQINHEWIYITSNIALEQTSNILNLRYPQAATSYLYRIIFDYILCPLMIRRIKPDRIVSLQNVEIPWIKTHQSVYLHMSLPFTSVYFSFRQDMRLWFYQNIYKYRIRSMLRRANEIIVQTKWMKDGCIALADISPEKVIIKQPNVVLDDNISYVGGNKPLFIYPANGHFYKNHHVILEAAIILAERGIYEYEIDFTLTGNETKNISAIAKFVKRENLPIRFIGSIPYHELQKYYCYRMLVFPSYIESFGLPLLEARLAGTPVVAANTPFAQEILDGYLKAKFFTYDKGHDLADIIQKIIISYKGN